MPVRPKSNVTGGVRKKLIAAARRLSKDVDALSFADPVSHVYNPLDYAWKSHQAYLSKINDQGVRIVLLGMNPGPWGMAQTGVPFGEIAAARDWMGINEPVKHPVNEHPKRPIQGFDCPRSEVSGRRLWGLFSERFESADAFFSEHFVVNYCPLVFMESTARNRTPDKLPASEREPLDAACDRHLKSVLKAVQPEIAIGVGAYAEKCLQRTIADMPDEIAIARILHPSPASPAANKDWAGSATQQLIDAGVWN
ncbi:Uracil DNA glycosylase superfamily protein [Rubripirellula lacrimiformis]|uniref:Uracil DNA glycosylase superfamily protein n=1 Tax=Rubripirellula lacrimiformis TaxID=1930273 RepID=A0A517N8X9_9BACT|nr:uracil-DNA glycosylase family protein [Rubripirellula lacrimiformis]QDT03587.1 Uracil DNA glycosylase superfamily protein [Rubripirellula lacrimiformis]